MQIEKKVFKKRAKTFYLASLFFPYKKRMEVETLYNFCRLIDDIGDIKKKNQIHYLIRIKKEIQKKKTKNKIIQNFLEIKSIYKIHDKIPINLIEGVISDLGKVDLKNIRKLLEYSYKVAGTVGIMMGKLMGVNKKMIYLHAVELGIAMQITNICRDIKEDLEMNRIYFPKTLRRFNYRSSKFLLNDKNEQNKLSRNIVDLINISDKLYAQAKFGIIQLPIRYKFVILSASNLYQEIGKKILKNPKLIWKKRVYVTIPKKIIIIFYSLYECLFIKPQRNEDTFSINYIKKKFL